MKLPCKVIEDMLPLYYDGVCSEESSVLVEEHLIECPGCRNMLCDLRSEAGMSAKPYDDLKPLKGIQKRWKKSKQTYIKRGICITLVSLLLALIVLTGIWYFSYARYYFEMAGVMERTPDEDAFFSSSDYTVESGEYRFELWMPIVMSNSGFARVMDNEGIIMFLYPQTGGSYNFWFYVTDERGQAWSVYLKKDMSPDFEGHPFPNRSELEKEHIQDLISQKRSSIFKMLSAVYDLWGIELGIGLSE